MASMYEDNGTWTIQFVGVDRKRKTIRLPSGSKKKTATTWQGKVESLLSALMAGCSPDREISAWVGSLPDSSREKLEKVGLVEPREGKAAVPTVASFVAGYVAKRSHQRPNTLINLRRAETMLLAFVGPEKRLDQFTRADASDWWHSMLSAGYAQAGPQRDLLSK